MKIVRNNPSRQKNEEWWIINKDKNLLMFCVGLLGLLNCKE